MHRSPVYTFVVDPDDVNSPYKNNRSVFLRVGTPRSFNTAIGFLLCVNRSVHPYIMVPDMQNNFFCLFIFNGW